MGQWYYEFEENPYKTRPEPMFLSDKRIIWNRDDLDDKDNLNNFINSILEGRAVGLRVYGGIGSGKTWLVRYIQKELKAKSQSCIFFYSRLVGAKSTFSEFYFDFISDTAPELEKLLHEVTKKVGKDIEDWKKYWDDPNLGMALHHINSEDEHKALSMIWLKGEPLSPSLLNAASINVRLASDSQKIEVLEKILHKASELFAVCILALDDIALVKRGFGRELGRIIKDIFDGFYEKFGLICTYTGETSDSLLDSYDQHFYERFEYEVGLRPIKKEYLPQFLKLHHSCYRQEDAKVEDQLYPFTEEAIKTLANLMDPAKVLPRCVLKSCGNLVLAAGKSGRSLIDGKFIEENKDLIVPEARLRG